MAFFEKNAENRCGPCLFWVDDGAFKDFLRFNAEFQVKELSIDAVFGGGVKDQGVALVDSEVLVEVCDEEFCPVAVSLESVVVVLKHDEDVFEVHFQVEALRLVNVLLHEVDGRLLRPRLAAVPPVSSRLGVGKGGRRPGKLKSQQTDN